MAHPLALSCCLALALPGITLAQAGAPHASRQLAPITGPIRHAGTYHAATGTWTRSRQPAAAARGLTDNLYSNTAGSGYFEFAIGPTGAASGGLLLDEGVVPSPSDPTPYALGGPGRAASDITSVQIGYCDLDPAPGVSGWRLEFYSGYSPCTFPPEPLRRVGRAELQGAPSNGCWIVDIDLSGAPLPLLHDGDGSHSGVPSLDSFGVSWEYTGSGSLPAGALIAGDPVNTDTGFVAGGQPNSGSNTYYGEVGGCPGSGSGLGNLDSFWIEEPAGGGGLAAGSNCYFFGGYANAGSGCGGPLQRSYGGFWLELAGAPISTDRVLSEPGCTGFPNATGVPGQIEVTGAYFAALNVATLRAFNLPPNQFGIFTTGLAPMAPGIINAGNGTLCIDPGSQGGLGRFDAPNQIRNTGPNGEMTLETSTGAWSVFTIPTSVGTYSALAGITTYFQAWHREPVGAGFNFTGSCRVFWRR